MRNNKTIHTSQKHTNRTFPPHNSPKHLMLTRSVSILGFTVFLSLIELLNRYILPENTLLQSIVVTVIISFLISLLLHYLFAKKQQQRSRQLQQQRDALLQAHHDKDKVIEILKEALDEIKTLSGLLPICASCKKIRDDEGYWHQVESFIRKHTHAEFTHSLCPECLEKLYPEQKDTEK
jgi:uncharacterized membrane protein YraQ (UPF0718 family)